MGMGPTNGPDASRIERPISSMERKLVPEQDLPGPGRLGLIHPQICR